MTTQTTARYASIGFQGKHAEHTFVHLHTQDGEVRAHLDTPEMKKLFCSRNIGKLFTVTLDALQSNGRIVESRVLNAEFA